MIVGIDNGLDGGIVLMSDHGAILDKEPMPTISKGKGRDVNVLKLASWMSLHSPRLVVIEEASKHSAGTLALCSTWFSYGSILAVLKLSSVRYEIVRPQSWQKSFWARPKMAKGAKFDTKAAALNAATRLWPNEDWTKSERASKPHDGMIDAALIAEHARRAGL